MISDVAVLLSAQLDAIKATAREAVQEAYAAGWRAGHAAGETVGKLAGIEHARAIIAETVGRHS